MSEQQACGCLRYSIGMHRLVRRNFYRQNEWPRTPAELREMRRPQTEDRPIRRSDLHQSCRHHQNRPHRREDPPTPANKGLRQRYLLNQLVYSFS